VQDDFDALAQRLIQSQSTPKLDRHQQEKKRIEHYYSPRERFNRWRDSEEGKTWKALQHKALNGNCPKCGDWFSIGNLEIDHIDPIAKFPGLATTLSNLRLLCSACNKRKSNSCK
jgi:5-methylcytosine-specific restriction endonuclease McrA